MSQSEGPPPGPDFAAGVPLASIPAGGVLAGRVGDDAVLLARLADGVHAIAAHCTHYGGPLAEGLVVGDEIRCPWHHACFSLRTGHARHAPAFAPLARWRTEVAGDTVFVRGPVDDGAAAIPAPAPWARDGGPRRIAILGGGAAGYAAALRLRELGYDGALSMFSADPSAPYDRPNLSKDYLAGTAPEEWIPLQGDGFYRDNGIDLHLDCEIASVDAKARRLQARSGPHFDYDALLFATGSEPRRLPLPGFDGHRVFALRSLADARAIIAAATGAKSVAFIGAGFIGLEAAAALQARGLEVHVVAPEPVPMERVLGRELGEFLAGLHRASGVRMRLGAKPAGYDGMQLALEGGERIAADLLVVGAGVAPRTALAEAAGLATGNGILVDEFLQASVPGHYAAGDVASYLHRGERARVEHWVHAQRQGQAVAANLLGAAQPFRDVPFFWTHQHDIELRYIGLGAGWDETRTDGGLTARDFTVRYYRGGELIAAASCGRDRESLEIEAALRDAA
jgi:NADPH-dependent 2,4-dienoyl-CoA reductase/sulfur reductase-like enzyme/nitrite reductase/ring-hydroxylating ferredoxin subunit